MAAILSLDLLSYLQSLPSAVLLRLYQHPLSCLAVYRSLSELSQLYIMKMLFIDVPLSISDVNSWPAPGNNLHQESITLLMKLKIFENAPLTSTQHSGIRMNPLYQTHLKILICGGGQPVSFGGHSTGDKHSRDINYLNDYADKKWEGILNFMVSAGQSTTVDREILDILKHAGLMSQDSSSFITTLGFQFLLMDTPSQVWYFILQYFKSAQERGLDLIDCLTFTFQLSFSTLGKDYSVKGLTQTQLVFLQHLIQFGLAYQRKMSSKRYYPTKLVIQMTSGYKTSLIDRTSKGYLVVETNYRIIGYTNSQLQIAMLGLFSQLHYKFPNMVVGTITRESTHQALIHGITAEQILSFLTQKAHSNMLKKKPIIPSTVSDQIKLWEIERNRLQFQEGILYSDFLTASDYDKVKKYAEDLGVLLWHSQVKRLMVIHPSRHNEIRHFWKRQKH